ncbi:MAG: HAMP domain-containing histidine kinase [Lachnospiraceae bacterium]|nr:HAMP domain-containing histidine kinase [Lachnospiraceae bacterium]
MDMNQQFQDVIKKDRFPVSLFGIYLVVMLLMSGVHTGIIVFMGYAHWSKLAQTFVPIVYWSLVAIGLTLFTKKRVRETYEEPMIRLSEAAKQVAEGDFSVYVPTIHTMEKIDYLDMMILNFNKLVEELGSVETLKTDFVSNVSHEMKTPIAIIKNYAELLRQDNLSEEKRKEYGEIIEHAAVKLSALITNILRLNKLENQTITPERKDYDVSRQLCECILQFEELWEEKELEIDVDIEDSAVAFADENLMEIVWNNLLSNAIKFTESGGSIRVSQETEERYLVIRISDTGCGMSETNMKHIFDKFYQGDTSHSKEGNGLGLALVKRVLELMDGKIEIESVLGKGSTFIVKIPVRKED